MLFYRIQKIYLQLKMLGLFYVIAVLSLESVLTGLKDSLGSWIKAIQKSTYNFQNTLKNMLYIHKRVLHNLTEADPKWNVVTCRPYRIQDSKYKSGAEKLLYK